MAYGIFNARQILSGPKIIIKNPNKSEIYTENKILEISGLAKNATSIYINGKSINMDAKGNFREELLLYSGFNIITLYAKDRFGSEVYNNIKIYYITKNK